MTVQPKTLPKEDFRTASDSGRSGGKGVRREEGVLGEISGNVSVSIILKISSYCIF